MRSWLARLTPTYRDPLVHKATHGRRGPLSQNDNIYMFLGALRQLIESPAPFKAVRLEFDCGQVGEPDAEGRHE